MGVFSVEVRLGQPGRFLCAMTASVTNSTTYTFITYTILSGQ